MYTWHFNNFPLMIQEHLYEEARTIVLSAAIELFDATKGAKFTSFFGTRLNFLFRLEYQKFFQKGKPITKRYGRLHELSIDLEYKDNKTLADVIPNSVDVRKDVSNLFLYNALDTLSKKDRHIIDSLYFNGVPKSALSKKLNINRRNLDMEESNILTRMKLEVV